MKHPRVRNNLENESCRLVASKELDGIQSVLRTSLSLPINEFDLPFTSSRDCSAFLSDPNAGAMKQRKKLIGYATSIDTP
jgi:hypothetical protein